MAKKAAKKCSKVKIPKTTTLSKDDCDEGSCPIDKKKKKTVATQTEPAVETKVPQVSLCSKIMAALFFWK